MKADRISAPRNSDLQWRQAFILITELKNGTLVRHGTGSKYMLPE